MTVVESFVLALAVTVLLLALVVWTGLRARRKTHVALVALTLLALVRTIFAAECADCRELLGHARVFTAAMRGESDDELAGHVQTQLLVESTVDHAALDEAVAQRIERHLADCGLCRDAREALAATMSPGREPARMADRGRHGWRRFLAETIVPPA